MVLSRLTKGIAGCILVTVAVFGLNNYDSSCFRGYTKYNNCKTNRIKHERVDSARERYGEFRRDIDKSIDVIENNKGALRGVFTIFPKR